LAVSGEQCIHQVLPAVKVRLPEQSEGCLEIDQSMCVRNRQQAERPVAASPGERAAITPARSSIGSRLRMQFHCESDCIALALIHGVQARVVHPARGPHVRPGRLRGHPRPNERRRLRAIQMRTNADWHEYGGEQLRQDRFWAGSG
jgi:hypothetical protein